MKRKRRKHSYLYIIIRIIVINLLLEVDETTCFLLKTNCLTSAPKCDCSWKSGKFVADCSNQHLSQVPKNDYFDYLLDNAGNNQMPTLNRDIQQINLASNNFTNLDKAEFYKKNFKNLQKINLNNNQISLFDLSTFQKLNGLRDLDLSDNLISEIRSTSMKNDEDDLLEINSNNELIKFNKDITTNGDHFSQLRQLNLNSNQLIKLQKFALSSLPQLQRLFLSRNKISFIDKRAFDGLNVLNILHLDGNKLIHLDGEILLKLPQLYELQLAGSNVWRCDCNLRKLVRLLVRHEKSRGAPTLPYGRSSSSAVSQQAIDIGRGVGASILKDEPECFHDEPEQAIQEDAAGPQKGRFVGRRKSTLWTNMTLADFQCPPREALNLMPNLEQPSSDTQKQSPETRRLTMAGQCYLQEEPVELTCAAEMSDELDLELYQLDWLLQVVESTSGRRSGEQLLWSSSGLSATSQAPTQANGAELAVIDYVTRVNGSDAGRLSLARVSHLIGRFGRLLAELGTKELAFVCQVSGSLGHLRVEFPVAFESGAGSARGRLAAQARLRQRSAVGSLGELARVRATLASQPRPWSSLRAAERLAALDPNPAPGTPPLFLPLHLPAELSDETDGQATATATNPNSQARSVQTGSQERWPAPRQTAQLTSTNATGSGARTPPEVGRRAWIAPYAAPLIGRYSSNRRALVEPPDADLEATPEAGPQEQPTSGLIEPAGRFLFGWLAGGPLERWLQVATRDGRFAPLVLGICGGLVAGCLLSGLVAVRVGCRRRRRRVSDGFDAALGAGQEAKSRAGRASATNEDDADDDDSFAGDEADDDDDAVDVDYDQRIDMRHAPLPGGAPPAGSSSSALTSDSQQQLILSSADESPLVHVGQLQPLSGADLSAVYKLGLAPPSASASASCELDEASNGALVWPPSACEMSSAGGARLAANSANLDAGAATLKPPGPRLIVLGAQRDVAELVLSPEAPYYELKLYNQQEHLEHQRDSLGEPSTADDSSLITHYHCNRPLSDNCQQVSRFELATSGGHWPTAGSSDDQSTMLDDYSLDLLQQPSYFSQQHFVVEPMPKLRSISELHSGGRRGRRHELATISSGHYGQLGEFPAP